MSPDGLPSRPSAQWLLTERTDGTIELPALGCELPLSEIYAGLDLLA